MSARLARCAAVLATASSLLAVSLLTAPPASALSVLPAQTLRGCAGHADADANAQGVVWAATSCSDVISLTERSATGALRHFQAPWRGDVLAVADDGVATFVVFQRIADDTSHRLYIAKRTRSGVFSGVTTLDAGLVTSPAADVVAAGGRWWVVWSATRCPASAEPRGTCFTDVRQQKTYGGASRSVVLPEAYDPSAPTTRRHLQPSLDLDDRGNAILAFLTTTTTAPDAEGSTTTTNQLRLATAPPSGVWTEESQSFTQEYGQPSQPHVVSSGDRVSLAWLASGRPVVARGTAYGTGGFAVTTLTPRAPVTHLRMASSGGLTFVGYDACFSYSGGSTCRVYLSEVRSDLTSSTVDLVQAAGRTGPVRWSLRDLTASRGRASVVSSTATTIVGQTMR